MKKKLKGYETNIKNKYLIILFLIFAAFLCGILFYGNEAGWYIKSVKKLEGERLDYTTPCIRVSQTEKEAYTALTKAVLNHENEVKFTSTKVANSSWKLFYESSPLAFYVKKAEQNNNEILLSYRYWKVKQDKIQIIVDNQLKSIFSGKNKLGTTDIAKNLSLYHQITKFFKVSDYLCKRDSQERTKISERENMYSILDSKEITESELSRITAFFYAQRGIEAIPVESMDQSSDKYQKKKKGRNKIYGVYLSNENDSYFIFPNQEIIETNGNGFLGYGNNNGTSDYYFYHKEFASLLSKNQHARLNTDSTSMLYLHDVSSYKLLKKNVLKLYCRNESVSIWNLETKKRILERDVGFEFIKTKDNHRNYLYIPKEASKTNKRPLLICLHGALESSVAKGKYGRTMTKKELQKPMGGAFVLVMTSVLDYYRDAARYNQILKDILKSHPEIDSSKIMIYGFSNGSAFACEMLIQDPDLYQGVLISGCLFAWDQEKLKKVSNKHFWLMNGVYDEKLIVDAEHRAYEQMKEKKIDIVFHEFSKGGHSPVNMYQKIPECNMTAVEWMCKKLNIKN